MLSIVSAVAFALSKVSIARSFRPASMNAFPMSQNARALLFGVLDLDALSRACSRNFTAFSASSARSRSDRDIDVSGDGHSRMLDLADRLHGFVIKSVALCSIAIAAKTPSGSAKLSAI